MKRLETRQSCTTRICLAAGIKAHGDPRNGLPGVERMMEKKKEAQCVWRPNTKQRDGTEVWSQIHYTVLSPAAKPRMASASEPVLVMPDEAMGSVVLIGTEVTLDKARDTNGPLASTDTKFIMNKASADVGKVRVGRMVRVTIGSAEDVKVLVAKFP